MIAFLCVIAIADMYYNRSKDFCLDVSQGQGGIPGGGPWSDSWGYQSCTETLHKFSARGFRNFTYSDDFASKQCQGFWKTTPQPQRTETHFGARAVLKEAGSRLIFSNGLLEYANKFQCIKYSNLLRLHFTLVRGTGAAFTRKSGPAMTATFL